MNSDTELTPVPSAPLDAELARSLVFALVWSSEVTARFGELATSGTFSFLVAALGCTAFTLGATGVVTARRATTCSRPLHLILAALLASGPAALLARVLQGKTHHRALGGVTFALLAGVLVAASALVVRRLLGSSPGQSRRRSVLPGVAVATLVVISMGMAIGPLVRELGTGGSPSGRWLAQDLAIGLMLSGLVAVVPRVRLPSRVALAGAALWVVCVGAGAVLVSRNMPLRAILSEHAPVALGFIGGL